jgi:hypothetical protein
MGYNGWTNRETWLVNLWFEPQSKLDVLIIQEVIEEDVANCPAYLQDFINLHHVNWQELSDHFPDEDDDEPSSENDVIETTQNKESDYE